MAVQKLETVAQAFNNSCDAFPARPAQQFNAGLYHGDNNGAFSYTQLRERVEAIACGLLKSGFKKGDKAAIMAPSSPYWTHVDMALANAGGVSVTIYPTLSLREVLYIMKDSGSKYLFVGNEEILKVVKPGLGRMTALKQVVVMDLAFKGKDKKIIGLTQLMETGREWKIDHYSAYTKRWKSVGLDDPYTILYTSGTTGEGKGVILTHWCASSRLAGTKEYFHRYGMDITENDVTLCFLPLSHIFDRGSCQGLALWEGACIAYADKPGTLLEDMQKYNPTWINCVPRLYEKIYITFKQQMAASPPKKAIFDWAFKVGTQALEYRSSGDGCYDMTPGLDLASRLPLGLRIRFKIADKLFARVRTLFGNRFRFSFSASAGIAPDLLRFFYTLGLAVVEGYGSTESYNAAVLNPLTACKPGYMGKPANGSISRVAPDGELEISGAGIFKGYLNKPKDTKESFTRDKWFKTGDSVILSPDGYYKFVERKKAIICTATGKNIAPAKLENLFSTSSVIEQVFFIGDERAFITGLLVPNFNYFIDLFKRENIAYDESTLTYSEASGVRIYTSVGDDFIAQPVLRDLIDRDVKAANKKLEHFEEIKNYTILNTRFTEDNGQLTPTQKAKKRVILKDYEVKIEKMYAEKK